MIMILVISLKLIQNVLMIQGRKQKISLLHQKIKLHLKRFNVFFLNKRKPKTYILHKKIICGWTDKKNLLIHYRMLKFCVRHVKVIDKSHEIISFKQSNCLEKHINNHREKTNKAKEKLENDFHKLLINPFYGKTMENLRIGRKVGFIKKNDNNKTNQTTI